MCGGRRRKQTDSTFSVPTLSGAGYQVSLHTEKLLELIHLLTGTHDENQVLTWANIYWPLRSWQDSALHTIRKKTLHQNTHEMCYFRPETPGLTERDEKQISQLTTKQMPV